MKVFATPHQGALLRYHDLPGQGRPLLFIHGLGCASSCDYPAVAADPALAGRRRLLVDLLGSGFSDRSADFGYRTSDHASVLAALVASLGEEQVDLFGHSMGGSIAIELATLIGDRLGTLIVSEPNFDPGGGLFSSAIAAYDEADYIARGHAETVAAATKQGSGIWAASLAHSLPLAIHREATSLVAGTSPTWRTQLYALKRPRVAIFGAQSLPDADAERLPLEGVKVIVVPDVGHSMAWQNPSAVAGAIAQALCVPKRDVCATLAET